jgi:hypothetical protein
MEIRVSGPHRTEFGLGAHGTPAFSVSPFPQFALIVFTDDIRIKVLSGFSVYGHSEFCLPALMDQNSFFKIHKTLMSPEWTWTWTMPLGPGMRIDDSPAENIGSDCLVLVSFH